MTPGPILPRLAILINHFSLNVKNLNASLDFYFNIFGLRHLFTSKFSEHVSIAYVGHSQGGRNGTGFQTNEELNREKNNAAGLIEMIHIDIPHNDLPPSSQEPNSFGHIGIVVPDIEAIQQRLDYLGINILKRVGDPTPSVGPIANANGFPPGVWEQISEEERKVIEKSFSTINARYVYLQDPDGNIVEVQPQETRF